MSSAPRKLIPRLVVSGLLGGIVALLFGFASPAHADNIDQVLSGLRSQPLYVSHDSNAPLTSGDQQAVDAALNGAKSKIRIVVVKPVSKQTAYAHLAQLFTALGKKGTVALITSDGNMAGVSSDLSGSKITSLIEESHGQPSMKDRLIDFTQHADKAVQDKKSAASTAIAVVLGVLVVIAAGIGGLVFFVRRRSKQRKAAQLAELKQNIYEDVTRLGEDIAALNLNVTDQSLNPDTRNDYAQAMDSYDKAKSAVDHAQRPEDMRAVTTALEDGRFYMTAVRARLAGHPVPERRAPCFFNPQHGPSVQDVTWAPPGGAPREVPACAADAQRLLSGQDPDARLVSVGGYRRPYWEAGPMYAPYAGGYYSGFGGGGLLGPILIGTALGSMFGGGWGGGGYGSGYDSGYNAGFDAGNDGNNGGDGDGGFDIGGGDFDFGGGGDSGCGDWGGGGGDWGGGGGDW